MSDRGTGVPDIEADVLVVGAGMIGAAAARHLAADPSAGRVVVIGPAESPVAGPFGAWYDEARITRVIDDHDVWATLAEASIGRYPQIAQEGGRPFHEPRGVLYVHETDATFTRQVDVGRRHRAAFAESTPSDHPYLRTRPGTRLLHERGEAGIINPRTLVANQLHAAAGRGARVVRDHVVALDIDDSHQRVRARTAGGAVVQARRAVVAAGGYVQAFGLLPAPLQVTSVGITALFFRVDDRVAAELDGMPAIMWRGPQVHDDHYMLPPVRYPDGSLWFKIGGHHDSGPLQSAEEIDEWYRTDGAAHEAVALADWVAEHIPVLAGRQEHHIGCVITETPSGLPIIRQVAPGVVVATGCSGASAKSSDEIGRLAAVRCAQGRWDSTLDAALFDADR